MARKSRLLAALDVHRGRVYELEKQKQLQKQAKKRKRSQEPADSDRPHPMVGSSDGHESLGVAPSNVILSRQTSGVSHGDQAEESVDGEQDQEREDEGIPFSDIESLASSERADILPHQHLTIYNVNALLNVHKLITLPYVSLPFSAHQTLTTSIPVSIPDVNDDLNRELAFYKQCLDTARDGRALLKQEGILFSRPNDYFAEMVKSDEHMGKVKQKMVDEAANKKAASEARRQRDLKKFGKQVQVAKEQERAKARRETMDKISSLKRSEPRYFILLGRAVLIISGCRADNHGYCYNEGGRSFRCSARRRRTE